MGAGKPTPSAREEMSQGREDYIATRYSQPSLFDDEFIPDEVWEDDIVPEVQVPYLESTGLTHTNNPLYSDGNARDENGNTLGATVTGDEKGMSVRRRRV